MKEILDNPWFYELSQSLITLGGPIVISRRIKRLLSQLPPAESLLDVGCGPSSYLFRAGLRPVGVDLSSVYISRYMQVGEMGVAASAHALPFAPNSFGGIWTTYLLHHLPDSVALKTVQEFLRLCSKPGYVAILDMISPRSKWRRPLAALIHYLDRGKFIRSQEDLEALLPDRAKWSTCRITNSPTGLETLICLYVK